jgi:cytochrome c oxidase subunit 2
MAPRVDALYFFLVGVTTFFSLLIAGLIVFYAVKYRRRRPDDVGSRIHGSLALELVWTIIPLVVSMFIFAWGASVFVAMAKVPEETLNIYAVGKQWMWKFQHLNGQREINELHVPVGRAVKLIMTSEDVIHDLFVPAFRIKADVIPGRYTQIWFEPTRAGEYHLFCAEYCGTEHSAMSGRVVVLEAEDYQRWLEEGTEGSLAASGQALFSDLACTTCHRENTTDRGPALPGLFGSTVPLAGGGEALVDEAYLREAILHPAARIRAGYQPIMPSYQGLVTEEQLIELVEYIKNASAPGAAPAQASR